MLSSPARAKKLVTVSFHEEKNRGTNAGDFSEIDTIEIEGISNQRKAAQRGLFAFHGKDIVLRALKTASLSRKISPQLCVQYLQGQR